MGLRVLERCCTKADEQKVMCMLGRQRLYCHPVVPHSEGKGNSVALVEEVFIYRETLYVAYFQCL